MAERQYHYGKAETYGDNAESFQVSSVEPPLPHVMGLLRNQELRDRQGTVEATVKYEKNGVGEAAVVAFTIHHDRGLNTLPFVTEGSDKHGAVYDTDTGWRINFAKDD